MLKISELENVIQIFFQTRIALFYQIKSHLYCSLHHYNDDIYWSNPGEKLIQKKNGNLSSVTESHNHNRSPNDSKSISIIRT